MQEKYRVSVVKCGSYEPEKVNKALLTSLKNIDFKLKKGIKVLIKPNILGPYTPDQGITTHPIIIEELCKVLKKLDADIYIGDSSGLDTKRAIETSEVSKLSKYGKIINFDLMPCKLFETKIRNTKILLPEILFKVDLIINIAKLKTHSLTKATLSVKNLYGCIPGKLKSSLHKIFPDSKYFSRLLLEIEKKIKPQLNIIDGIDAIQGNGPGTSGEKIRMNLISSSTNPYALDIITSEIMGFNANEIYTNRFSGIKKEDIETVGDGKYLRFNIKKPSNYYLQLIAPLFLIFPKSKITFDKNKCTRCLACERKCPVNAIKIIPGHKCDHNSCIGCMCCTEVCPYDAVCMKDHWTIMAAKKSYRFLKKRFYCLGNNSFIICMTLMFLRSCSS